MADVFTKKKRSEIMSRIRSKNTDIEKSVFSFLKNKGIRFRRHYKNVSGNPDIAVPPAKKAVFIDGDFWHGYKFNKSKQKLPKKYWLQKITNNIKRDKKVNRILKKSGWKVLRFWEHDLRNPK